MNIVYTCRSNFEMEEEAPQKKKEIYSYKSPWTAYTMAWCRNQNGRFKMAVGSFIEEYSNQIQIIQLNKESNSAQFTKLCTFEHPYPATKVMWAPARHNLSSKDLLATTGDYLRIWALDSENSIEMRGVLNNNKNAGKFLEELNCSVDYCVCRVLRSVNEFRLE